MYFSNLVNQFGLLFGTSPIDSESRCNEQIDERCSTIQTNQIETFTVIRCRGLFESPGGGISDYLDYT